MEGAVAAIGADSQGLRFVLEGIWRGFGTFVDNSQCLALLHEGEVGIGAGTGDAAGFHVASDAKIYLVRFVAHRLQLSDGYVVAFRVAGCGDREPDDGCNDDGTGYEELCERTGF